MSATDYKPSELERAPIGKEPRFPSEEDRSRVLNGLLDVEDYLIEPFACCVFELLNEDEPPAVSFEEIGRLGCAVEEQRQVLRRMMDRLDRLDTVRDELNSLASGNAEEVPRFDRRGSLKRRPVDGDGYEIPWEWLS